MFPVCWAGLSCCSVCVRRGRKKRWGGKSSENLRTSFAVRLEGETQTVGIFSNEPTHSRIVQIISCHLVSALYFRGQRTLCFPTESVRKRIAPPWRRNIRNINKSRPSSASWRSCSANRKSPRPCDKKISIQKLSGPLWETWINHWLFALDLYSNLKKKVKKKTTSFWALAYLLENDIFRS